MVAQQDRHDGLAPSTRDAVAPADLPRVPSPRPLVWATRLLLGLGVVGLAVVVSMFVLHSEVVATWAAGNESAQEYLKYMSLRQFERERPIYIPAFAPVTATLFVVVAGLVAVLAQLVRFAHRWARLPLSGVVVMLAVGAVAAVRVGTPLELQALAYVSLVLEAGVLVLLWRPEVTAWLKAGERPARLPRRWDPSGR